MFMLNGLAWYTDKFDSFRVVSYLDGAITKQKREQILQCVECRIYHNPTNEPDLNDTAAVTSDGNSLCCAVDADVQAGDEIIVYRGAGVKTDPVSVERYFAGTPNRYVEPFGGILADLEHMQVALYNKERIV